MIFFELYIVVGRIMVVHFANNVLKRANLLNNDKQMFDVFR